MHRIWSIIMIFCCSHWDEIQSFRGVIYTDTHPLWYFNWKSNSTILSLVEMNRFDHNHILDIPRKPGCFWMCENLLWSDWEGENKQMCEMCLQCIQYCTEIKMFTHWLLINSHCVNIFMSVQYWLSNELKLAPTHKRNKNFCWITVFLL